MNLCLVKTVDLATGKGLDEESVLARVSGSAHGKGRRDWVFGYWNTDLPGKALPQGTENALILMTSQQQATQVAVDLSRIGLQCEVLDGLPLALARVLQMNPTFRTDGPVGVIDWGGAAATMCVVIDGRPTFVRCVRNCGLGQVSQSLCQGLGISHDEAQQLLTRYGLPAPMTKNDALDDVSTMIREVAAEPLNSMVDEVNRTMSFLKTHRPELVPSGISLFGGGATVRNVDAFLSAKAGVPVRVWRWANGAARNGSAGNGPSQMLGPAIALSSLAWVKQC